MLFISLAATSQQPAVQLTAKDSADILGELASLLDSADEPTSYILIQASIGNRLFSLHNNQLNAKQSSTNTIVYTPSVGYFHKSGFNLSGGAYLLSDPAKGFGANQFSITPAYDMPTNDRYSIGVSYTRYFVKDKFSPYSSPVQNDWYASFVYKKPWLGPGIAVGYSTGEYRQSVFKDSTINGRRRILYDSTTNNIRAFSMMLSESHTFDWYDVFKKDDLLEVTPSVILNVGSSNTAIAHNTNAVNLLRFLTRRGKLKRQQNTSFQAESVGLNIDCSYTTGNFSFNPQLYFDYYLPATSEKRFTQVFTLSLGYAF